jgi:peptidoglycan/xylan/chitin deacetylase (PgdA/CDA1 family)
MPPARIVFYAATLSGVVFAARAIVIGPPPLWMALAASGAYAAVLLCGVFVLGLRMFADAVVRGPRDARGVALTFDDGPHPVHTRKVLDILDAHDAKATFFLIGRKVEKHPDVVAEIIERGHDVGVHGFAHDRLFSLRGSRRVRRDLEKAVSVIERVTKQRPLFFRPPIGHTNPTIARIAEQLDLTIVGWSVAAYDGIARAEPDRVAARVARSIDDGDIVLLHDAAELSDRAPAGIAALGSILRSMKDKKLAVARLRQWVDGS